MVAVRQQSSFSLPDVNVIAPDRNHTALVDLGRVERIKYTGSASDDTRHEHAEVAIKDAFAAARRQVDDITA